MIWNGKIEMKLIQVTLLCPLIFVLKLVTVLLIMEINLVNLFYVDLQEVLAVECPMVSFDNIQFKQLNNDETIIF